MNEEELKQRTKQFGANYRVAFRGKSKADFIAKTGISLESTDELVTIFIASIKTARANLKP